MPRIPPKVVAAVVAAVLVLGGGAYWALAGLTLPEHPLGWAPSNAAAVFRVRVPAITESKLWQRLAAAHPGSQERLTELCGSNPLETVEEVLLLVLSTTDGRPERFGLVARGHFESSALDCIEKVVREEGGELERREIEGFPAVGSVHGSSRAVFVDHETIVGGDEQTLHEILATVRGERPSMLGRSPMRELWPSDDGRPIGGVLVPPPTWHRALHDALTGTPEGAFRLEAITVSATLPDGAHIELRARASSPDGFAGAVRNKLALLPFARGIVINVIGSDVTLRADLAPHELDELLAWSQRLLGP